VRQVQAHLPYRSSADAFLPTDTGVSLMSHSYIAVCPSTVRNESWQYAEMCQRAARTRVHIHSRRIALVDLFIKLDAAFFGRCLRWSSGLSCGLRCS
jgi:hypothetical protein